MRILPFSVAVWLVSMVAAAGQSKPYDELNRPQFHFTAAKNWLNDPNGLVFYKGEYHLFFQHNPTGIGWGNMTWGHAVSHDLVHWRQLEHAILPDKLGTIFSGSAVVDVDNTAGFQRGNEKTLVTLYTAAGGTSPESKGQPFTQCLAYSTDRGRTWTKYDKNPVLGHIVKENRDPKVAWHAPSRRWIMALYKDGNDFALFSSPDLKAWEHLQDITMPGRSECPDFFEMAVDGDEKNTRWVLTAADGYYMVGRFDGRRFTPQVGPLQADWGGNYYAVQTYYVEPASSRSASTAPDSRRIQIAWMRGGTYPQMPFNQQMSFPCELKLQTFPEGPRLTRMPVKEIQSLRDQTHTWSRVTVKPGITDLLSEVSGDLLDIDLELAAAEASLVALDIRGASIQYLPAKRMLTCLGKAAEVPEGNKALRLRVLVDRTSIEVFANDGRLVMTSCFLPERDRPSLGIHTEGGPASITSLVVHRLRSAWPAAVDSAAH